MRKIILSASKDELKDDLTTTKKESSNSIDYRQTQDRQQTHQQYQTRNPFSHDVKYEFMLFAISPIAGAIYQIFKFFNWTLYSIGYAIGKLAGKKKRM